MARPSFLGNKAVICDFCGQGFFGNANPNNLVMCWRCVRGLCSWSEDKKIKFLKKFQGDKDREKLIKRFINEEVLDGEAQEYARYIPGRNNNMRILPKETKIWEIPHGIFLDPAGP